MTGIRYLLAVIVAVILATVDVHSEESKISSKEELERIVNLELVAGDSSDAILDFFKRHNIEFHWNEYLYKYEGIIREAKPNYSIRIFIYVDKKKRLSKISIHNGYTMP